MRDIEDLVVSVDKLTVTGGATTVQIEAIATPQLVEALGIPWPRFTDEQDERAVKKLSLAGSGSHGSGACTMRFYAADGGRVLLETFANVEDIPITRKKSLLYIGLKATIDEEAFIRCAHLVRGVPGGIRLDLEWSQGELPLAKPGEDRELEELEIRVRGAERKDLVELYAQLGRLVAEPPRAMAAVRVLDRLVAINPDSTIYSALRDFLVEQLRLDDLVRQGVAPIERARTATQESAGGSGGGGDAAPGREVKEAVAQIVEAAGEGGTVTIQAPGAEPVTLTQEDAANLRRELAH